MSDEQFYLDEIKHKIIDPQKYEKIREIGSGRFGQVFKVKCESKYYALKQINEFNETDFNREVYILSFLDHPCIIKLYGFSLPQNDQPATIVTQLLSNKTLKDVVLERQPGWNLTKQMINIYGIAKGMQYCHSQSVLHRDLKPENILLNSKYEPHIADFGLSKVTDVTQFLIQSNVKCTPIVAAPELLGKEECNEKIDVYSYALIVFFIFTGTFPYADETNFEKFKAIITTVGLDNLESIIPTDIPKTYQALILQCCMKDPEERPTFDILIEVLSNPENYLPGIDVKEFEEYKERVDKGVRLEVQEDENEDIQGNKESDLEGNVNSEVKTKHQIDRLTDLLIMLDNLENVEGLVIDGGNQSIVKEKRLDDKLVVMKKKKRKYKNSIYLTRLFFREVINQILARNPTVLPIQAWNFFHYSDKNGMFVYRHCLATPFCDGGTLGSYLLKMKKNNLTERQVETQKYLFAYGIARGMNHLYSYNIIHRDLKTQNIFVLSPKWENKHVPKQIKPLIDNGYLIPVIADLGFAKFTEEDEDQSNNYGTPLYEAPEQLISNHFSFPADVYSYGVTLSDILQLNRIPNYGNKIKNRNQLLIYVKGGGRPLMDKCTECQKKYLLKIMDKNASARPTFAEIVDYLESPLKTNYQKDPTNSFIFNDFDLDVIRAYKNFIDLSSNYQITDEKFYHFQNTNLIMQLIESIKMPDDKLYNGEISSYISTFLNYSIPISCKINDFYYKKGLQFEREKDFQNAKFSYMRAALFGSLESITKLGILLLRSSSSDDQIQGFKLLKLAAENKERDGLYSYAYLLTEGFRPKRVKKQLETAANLFIESAQLGHPKGYFMAASIYHQLAIKENDNGNTQKAIENLETAMKYYKNSYQEFGDKESENLFNDISKCLESI